MRTVFSFHIFPSTVIIIIVHNVIENLQTPLMSQALGIIVKVFSRLKMMMYLPIENRVMQSVSYAMFAEANRLYSLHLSHKLRNCKISAFCSSVFGVYGARMKINRLNCSIKLNAIFGWNDLQQSRKFACCLSAWYVCEQSWRSIVGTRFASDMLMLVVLEYKGLKYC